MTQCLHGMQASGARAGRMLANTAIDTAPATIHVSVNGSTIVGISWK